MHIAFGIPSNLPTLKEWRKSAPLIFLVFSAQTTGIDIGQLKIENATDGDVVPVEQLGIIHMPVKNDLGRRGSLDYIKDRAEGVVG